MSARSRIAAYGSAAMLVLIGALTGLLSTGATAQAIGIVLVIFGLGGALLLVFFEIGLSEDRARAQERGRKPPPTPPRHARRARFGSRWPRRPG